LDSDEGPGGNDMPIGYLRSGAAVLVSARHHEGQRLLVGSQAELETDG